MSAGRAPLWPAYVATARHWRLSVAIVAAFVLAIIVE